MIHFSNVGLRYARGAEALRDVTLSIDRGSMHFLTGRSGAGKSTLLKLMHFALRPTSGELTILGEDAHRATRRSIALLRRRIGVVIQDFQLLDHLTVFENVALPLMVAGHREAQYRNNVLEMLEWVKLSDQLDVKPHFLSGGEKQRVGIARAMVSVPDLILADEPTGSVDPEMGARIMSLFAEMNKLGHTILIATHDLDMVARYGAARLHLEDGRLERCASPSEISSQDVISPEGFDLEGRRGFPGMEGSV
ncbi:MAG: cell division ATP-binding protein FtsE [Rhodobacteraceae bacterium]|nr:cell division ATP-binding protein FtsE [Paracoccaceae bacterium]